MKLNILSAKDNKEMESISEELKKYKFKEISREKNFILVKKRRFGNTVIHLGLLFFALFFFYPLILFNLGYMSYSVIERSPHVLITTETKDDEGNDLEYTDMEHILEQANAIL